MQRFMSYGADSEKKTPNENKTMPSVATADSKCKGFDVTVLLVETFFVLSFLFDIMQ